MITEQTNGLERKQTNEQTFFNHSTKTTQQPEHSKVKLAERDIDKAARVAAKAGLGEYVEKLEAIARLLRKAVEKVVEKNTIVKDKKGTYYYLGPERVYTRVEHNGDRATITAKYGDEVATVELNIKEMERYAILANLAAIAVRDSRDIRHIHARHVARSLIQAADRLLMWAVFMPCEYTLTVEYVSKTRDGLLPYIDVRSFFGGRKKLAHKMLRRSPIHRLLLAAGAANSDYVLAVSWLMIYSILAAPEGGKPSDGAKSGAIPGAILEWLKPILEELDALLGTISMNDKAFLIAKMADYNGRIAGRKAVVKVGQIDDVIIGVDGDRISLLELIEAAAKTISEKGGTRLTKKKKSRYVVFYGIPPVMGPAIKAVAAVEVKMRGLEGLLEHGKPIRIGNVEVVPVEAREVVVEFTEGVMAEFKKGYYTHLRLVDGDEVYDLRHYVRARKSWFAGTVDGRIAEALGGVGRGEIYVNEDQLLAALATLTQIGVRAYAVRKAMKGEAEWIVKVDGVELRMSYHRRDRCLSRRGKNGKIPAIINGKSGVLDLKKLAVGDGEIERAVAEALNKAGISWRVVDDGLYIYLPRQTMRS